MHSDSDDDVPLSFSAKAYLIANSLQSTTSQLFRLFVGILVYIFLAMLLVFFSKTGVDDLKFWLPFTLIIFSSVIIWFFSRALKFYNLFKSWKEVYFEQSYIVIFDTIIPRGNNTVEKILNLSKSVFPEIRDDYVHYSIDIDVVIKYFFRTKIFKFKHKNLSRITKYNNKTFLIDIVLKTEEGYFIVKVFDEKKVTIDIIKEFIKVIMEKLSITYRRPDIFRTIIVAKNYDGLLLNRASLESLMQDKLKTSFPLDLVVEENVGFSILWIGK